MNEQYEKYAELLLKKCLNIQNETSMIINAPIESIDFIRVLARKAYEVGIKDIYFDYEDEDLKNIQLEHLELDDLYKSSFWNKSIYDQYAKKNAVILKLIAGEVDGSDKIAPEKIEKTGLFYRTSAPLYREKQSKDKISWCIASVPTQKWADKMFPDDKNSKEKLWNLIFCCCLIDQENPIEEWNRKLELKRKRTQLLNEYHFQMLEYKNSLGTNLKIELPENHIWKSASEKINGKDEIVNMPSEEVFTSPKRTGVNGIVYSSKPLIYNGMLIDKFYLEFKDGKVINLGAETGEEILRKLVFSAENSCYLGEVAFVEYNSPISLLNVVFYNTLFDENASCHLALGDGFQGCIENGETMTKEELLKEEINQSVMHTDFMVGTKDLEITGITHDQQKIKVFENGNFVL